MNISRIDIYDYIKGLFAGQANTIFKNVYYGEIPQTITDSDKNNGFIVIRLGALNDNSDFYLSTYCTIRGYIECYIPLYQGKMNTTKYKLVQNALDLIIKGEGEKVNAQYNINTDSVLTTEGYFNNNNNTSFAYIASFQITIT